MNKTTYWICDRCRDRINSPNEGWLQWVVRSDPNGENRRARDIRIVHHATVTDGKCYVQDCELANRETLQDGHLDWFLGADGLNSLLELLSRNMFPQDELMEIIKRLHIPGYEIARLHASDAIHEGIVEPNMNDGFFSQQQIANILEYASNEDSS